MRGLGSVSVRCVLRKFPRQGTDKHLGSVVGSSLHMQDPPLRLSFLPAIAREKREQRILKQGIHRENNLSVYLLSVLFPSRS
ncbi:hypothetical protein A2U01_0036132 [Trifolium medium]|uniref:Uncharacterized protein n=1 Tax=Trifolium medium TaxID=97028 RepID=A0A392PTL3_9FABA|nr:hypothetical protein [Trifolium medium]